MEKHEEVLAEIAQMREGAAALMRAKLEAVARQTRDLANRIAGDLDVVVPPDLEALFPIGSLAGHVRGLAAPAPAARGLDLDVLRKLDVGRAQSEVLQELLRQVGPWCGARAIVVLRDGTVQGWSGAGFGAGDPARTWKANLADSLALTKASAGAPVLVRPRGDAVLSKWFDSSERPLLLVPMLLRGKIVGILAALEGDAGLSTGVIQQLTYTVGLMLETLSTRAAGPNPVLTEPEDLTAESAAAVEPPVVAAPPAPEIFQAPAAVAAEKAAAAEEAPAEPVDAASTMQLAVPVMPSVPTPAAAPAAAAAAARTPEEERKHEEARRFARLLVSEIRLYNEQAVQAGKAAHDIYRRLKEDIDRSRDMYEQRVSAEVRADSSYFHDEMVRILADGDPEALGM